MPITTEQKCYAYHADKMNAGVASRQFDLESILNFSDNYTVNREFI